MNLNVGSGQRRFGPGWINVDLQVKKPEQVPDLQARGEQLPFPPESADTIVLHHVLEHYGCGEAVTLVKECWDTLRHGGELYIFVPDLKRLAQGLLLRQVSDQIYLTNVYGAYQGAEADRHRWGFTREYLIEFLKETVHAPTINWYNPEKPPEGADIAWDWWILGVQCIKQ